MPGGGEPAGRGAAGGPRIKTIIYVYVLITRIVVPVPRPPQSGFPTVKSSEIETILAMNDLCMYIIYTTWSYAANKPGEHYQAEALFFATQGPGLRTITISDVIMWHLKPQAHLGNKVSASMRSLCGTLSCKPALARQGFDDIIT
jgi:hypothetical protein